MSNVTSM